MVKKNKTKSVICKLDECLPSTHITKNKYYNLYNLILGWIFFLFVFFILLFHQNHKYKNIFHNSIKFSVCGGTVRYFY